MADTQKKEIVVQFYLPEQDVLAFEEICKTHDTPPGSLLREFVQIWNRTHLERQTMKEAQKCITPTTRSVPFVAPTSTLTNGAPV